MVKEPLAEQKFAIFKNWLDTRPKMETHEPNVYPTILEGVSRGFWSPFLDLGTQSAIFRHLKTGTFAKNVCFQVPKNGTSRDQNRLQKIFCQNSHCNFHIAPAVALRMGRLIILLLSHTFVFSQSLQWLLAISLHLYCPFCR